MCVAGGKFKGRVKSCRALQTDNVLVIFTILVCYMGLDFLILSELRFRDSLISKLGLTGIPFLNCLAKKNKMIEALQAHPPNQPGF